MPRVTLESRLPAISAGLRPAVSRAVKETAEQVAKDARNRVAMGPPPVHIKDHIEVIRKEAAGYYVAATARDEKGRPYARWHEFGTKHTPAFPFLVPALEQNRDNAEFLVSNAIRSVAWHNRVNFRKPGASLAFFR